jgi:hypothetical protein
MMDNVQEQHRCNKALKLYSTFFPTNMSQSQPNNQADEKQLYETKQHLYPQS